MKPLCNAGVLYPSDSAVKMHPYRAQALMANKQNMKFFHTLSMLGGLSRAMLYLVSFHISVMSTRCKIMDRLQDHIQPAIPLSTN